MSVPAGLPVVRACATERAGIARHLLGGIASRAAAVRPAEKAATPASPVEATRLAAAGYPAASLEVVGAAVAAVPVVADRIFADELATLPSPPAPVLRRGSQ
jgi:hypothetical protein